MIEEESLKESSSEIRAFLPISVSSFILNEKRNVLSDLEQRSKVRVVVVPDPQMETPHYRVERIRTQDSTEEAAASYHMTSSEDQEELIVTAAKSVAVERAAVQTVAPPAQPVASDKAKPGTKAKAKPEPKQEGEGFISRILGKLFGSEEKVEPKPASQKRQSGRNRSQNSSDGQSNQNRRPNNDRKRQDNRQDNPRTEESRKPRDNKQNDNKQTENKRPARDETGDRKNDQERKRSSNRPNERKDQNSRNDRNDQTEGGEGRDKRNRGNRERSNRDKRVREEEVTATQEVSAQAAASEKAVAVAPVASPEPTKAPEQPVATIAANESPVEKTPQEPAAATLKAPVKAIVSSNEAEKQDSSPKKQEAAVSEVAKKGTHPATLGRGANDPRDNPAKLPQSSVLQPAVAKTAAPSPLTTPRTVAESHPSLKGRMANDPRAARQSSDEEEADQAAQ